jgi:hypothetical protein
MIAVKYPTPSFKIKKEDEQHYVFDAIRKTWLLLTEEEWVRQNFIQYMIEELHYPAALIAIEKEIELNGLKKRFDILVYDAQHKPWMLIECKAPHIELNDAVVEQVLRYHISIPVSFLVITNGKATCGWEKIKSDLKILDKLPEWKYML